MSQNITYLKTSSAPHISTLIMAAALGAIAMNMFLPSLPSMTEHFNTSSGVMQLAVSGYLAATGAIQLFLGPLADRYGRRPVLLVCFFIFLLGTLICIYAPTIEILLFGRIIQAFSAAGMVLSRAIVRDLVEPAKAASMIGYVTMGMTLGPMLAPIMGGYLDEWFGWHAVFWTMLAVGTLIWIVTYLDLGETNKHMGGSFSQQFAQYPLLLKSRRFWGYVITMAFSAGAFFAFLGGGPFIASDYYHLSPSRYGLYFMFVSVGYMSGNFITGRVSERLGISTMILMGAGFVSFGLIVGLILQGSGMESPAAFFGPILFVGLGNGMTLPSAAAGIVSVRPQLAGTASGLGGSFQIGGGAAIAAFAGAMVAKYPFPSTILLVMLASTIIGMFAAFYTIYVDRMVAESQS